MKIDLKVPCQIDMSIINRQMAIVDQKKMELKKAIDALAHTSVELVLGHGKTPPVEVEKKKQYPPSPKLLQLPTDQRKKDFMKALYDMKLKETKLFFDAFSEQQAEAILEEIWGVVLALLSGNTPIAQQNDVNGIFQPDYPEWRDLLNPQTKK